MSSLDHATSAFVSETLPHPRWFSIPLGAVSMTANYGILWYVLAALPWLSGADHGLAVFIYVSAAVLATELITNVVKRLVGRSRPAQAAEGGHIPLPISPSFPSAHASMGVVGALTLSSIYPAWAPFLVLLVAVLVFSRVYLRVHYIADVVAGLALGAVLGVPYVLLINVT